MANIGVDIDWDDFLYDCSSYEKQKILDSLYGDGYSPSNECVNDDNIVEIEPESTSEVELANTLEGIWENRLFLNSNDLKSLKHYANKGLYEN